MKMRGGIHLPVVEHCGELEAFCLMGLSNGALGAEDVGGHVTITEPPIRTVSSLEVVQQPSCRIKILIPWRGSLEVVVEVIIVKTSTQT